jgi:hypothetical protein
VATGGDEDDHRYGKAESEQAHGRTTPSRLWRSRATYAARSGAPAPLSGRHRRVWLGDLGCPDQCRGRVLLRSLQGPCASPRAVRDWRFSGRCGRRVCGYVRVTTRRGTRRPQTRSASASPGRLGHLRRVEGRGSWR